MLKFGDVSFDLGFERGKMSATGHVAKISMLRLNIGSGKLSSCMLSIGRGPKAVQGKGGGCPPLPCSHLGPRPMLSMHELSLSMPEPMLSLSMLILAKSGQSKSKSWLTQSRPKVIQKLAQSRPKVGPKSAKSRPKVKSKVRDLDIRPIGRNSGPRGL